MALVIWSPPPAHAQPPAPDKLLRLDDRVSRTRGARITTLSSRFVAKDVRVSVEGLSYGSVLRTTQGDAPPIAGSIPWEDVVRVEVPSNHALAGFLVTGLVVGGIMGASVYSAGQAGNDIGGGGIALLAVPVVAILGGVVGSQMPSWHPIYRRADPSAR